MPKNEDFLNASFKKSYDCFYDFLNIQLPFSQLTNAYNLPMLHMYHVFPKKEIMLKQKKNNSLVILSLLGNAMYKSYKIE